MDPTHHVGIIVAMEVELQAVLAHFAVERHDLKTHPHYTARQGTTALHFIEGGVGKVNAAVSAMLLLTSFPIDAVVVVGTAGGIVEGQRVGDVVVGTQVCWRAGARGCRLTARRCTPTSTSRRSALRPGSCGASRRSSRATPRSRRASSGSSPRRASAA